jgi:hypothetical protein
LQDSLSAKEVSEMVTPAIVRISSGDPSLMGTEIVVTHHTEGDENFFNISWQQEGFLPHEMVVVREDQDGEVQCLHRCGCGGYGEEEKIEGNASHRLTTADRKTGEPAKFSLDHSPSFDGEDFGDTWNGWACPTFTKDVAHQIIAWLTKSSQEYDPTIPPSYFDEATKEFVIYGYGPTQEHAEGLVPERHGPYPDGTYGIGSHDWCWWRDDEEEVTV